MDMPKFVLIGHVCIDHNTSEHATYKGWGSSVFYMANYLKKSFALEPVVVANYGPDMLDYAPDVTLLPVSPSKNTTLIYENDSRSGKRTQRCFNIDEATPPALDQAIQQVLHDADALIVAPLLDNYPAEYVRELLEVAKPRTIKVLCPQGYFRQVAEDGRIRFQDCAALDEIAPLFDLVFYSEEDHPRALELATAWSKQSDVRVVVTKGAAGARVFLEGRATDIPTTPIAPEKIVDSVGCGDVFAASCVYAFYQSQDITAAIQAGHLAAGHKLLNTPAG